MTKVILLSILFSIFSFVNIFSQTKTEMVASDSSNVFGPDMELKGLVFDQETKEALPYANIYVLNKNKGAITNEKGQFTIDVSFLEKTDTLRFQYIGYKTKKITLSQFDTLSVVNLKEDIINLNEAVIFGSVPDLESIVKNVLIYKDSNYRKTTSKKQAFIREREIADITNFNLIYKKSTIDELDRAMIQELEERSPKNVTSYTDFLGHLYFTENKDDSVKIKIDPVRMVSLKEEYLEDLKQLESLFEGIFSNTGEEEYWKVRSGIFSQKLNLEENEESKVDSLVENRRKIANYGRYINSQISFSLLDDKDDWEFLHKTGKYEYTLVGGTWVNGEAVYIIDFKPDKSGLYIGRMYIARNTYALIRADYEYAPEKTGTDLQLLGVGYTENHFSGSIYFEKKDDNYALKYFSHRLGATATISRSIVLMKKKKRFLFDKKLKELKVGLDIDVNAEESYEYFVLDEDDISQNQFNTFRQKEYMEVIYVDHFDENLWRGYSIIEPTTKMKEYKKHDEIHIE